ncbi:helix-turn-helix domain-containing protein [Glutamicibacter sp. PS]|uniref:ArsR/SmtB family transcription factor n=1 Tax=Glutamicibacter sp. PS TaxID=3075634 RepID=UPI002843E420|nr:helix-turn-helix domain-containing protein [Glutamicibacter sp. PS]MDR4534110.1 helix-turn-helix domain-containing protein [Glutamicibacter sp. PS]
MTDIYRALDDATRRKILDVLSERDGQSLFELCGMLTMHHGVSQSRQSISQHLSLLEEAGLIRVERAGRVKLHYFTPGPLAEITRRWPLAIEGDQA